MSANKLLKPSAYIERGWCQHRSARNVNGGTVTILDPEAVAWCLSGALQCSAFQDRESKKPSKDQHYKFLKQVTQVLRDPTTYAWNGTIAQWNDVLTRTQEDVLALLHRCNL